MIEYRSEPPGEQRPDDATGELSAGRSLVPERVRLAGRSRAVRLTWSAASAFVLIAAVVAAVRSGQHTTSGPTAAPPSAASPLAARPPAMTSPLDQVSALAATHDFQTFVRQSSNNRPCPTVAPDSDPQQTVAAVVAASIPGVTVIGASPTIDQFTGMCALNEVLHDPHGGWVTVSIAAPTAVPRGTLDAQQVGLQNVAAGVVEYAMVTWHTGWRVLVGAVGAAGTVATTTELNVIAHVPALLW